ncbi:hypothetical protein C0585_01180 [Candidatus Woesearchaeota archaeon]|nr:MAG: hypothetical protein C0585_01180 [Candidatus Woesearchaeota archaeon]
MAIGDGNLDVVIVSIIIGTLASIVYSLRVLILMERRIARMDENLGLMVKKIIKEEDMILKEEAKIEKKLHIK